VTVPAIGAIGAVLGGRASIPSLTAGLSPGETSSSGAGATSGSSTGLGLTTPASSPEQAAGTGSLAGIEGVAGTEGTAEVAAKPGVEGSGGGGAGGFGEALTQAISSLQQTQTSADSAAQALATGTAANPESAVVTVADAQLAMQLASQIRTKAVEAAQQIFQTQV
jgi:flagellar hook-basal body complex protein FliE